MHANASVLVDDGREVLVSCIDFPDKTVDNTLYNRHRGGHLERKRWSPCSVSDAWLPRCSNGRKRRG